MGAFSVFKTKAVKVEKNGIPFMEFDSLKPYQEEILAVFSTRLGGQSQGPFASMNLAFGRGDFDQNVRKNFQRFTKAIGVVENSLVFSSQYHHNHIRQVTLADLGKGFNKDRDYQDIDGLVTNIPKIPLVTFHADCAPIYFYDPIKKVIGLAHAGWKGTSMGIVLNMVEKMEEEFFVDPKNVIVVIGPSICVKCYEVGDDVKREFEKLPIESSRCFQWDDSKKKVFLDLEKANQSLLITKGVQKENIFLSSTCTMENRDLFFSHRGHGGIRGTQVAIMQML